MAGKTDVAFKLRLQVRTQQTKSWAAGILIAMYFFEQDLRLIAANRLEKGMSFPYIIEVDISSSCCSS
jgi:hypothetical protein